MEGGCQPTDRLLFSYSLSVLHSMIRGIFLKKSDASDLSAFVFSRLNIDILCKCNLLI